MSKFVQSFALSGKVWLGMWSFVYLLLAVYSVLCEKPIGEGAIMLYVTVVGAYTANRTAGDWKKKTTGGKVDSPE